MNDWAEINLLIYSKTTIAVIIFFFIVFNTILYILFNNKKLKWKTFHRIISSFNILAELFIIIVILHQFHVLFIIFAPFIVIFFTAVGYGINKQLSDEDKNIAINNDIIIKTSFNGALFKLISFPGCYLIESWKKK